MAMNSDEYLELEKLLGKLEAELNQRFSITRSFDEVWNIGVFNKNGVLNKEAQSWSIMSLVKILKA